MISFLFLKTNYASYSNIFVHKIIVTANKLLTKGAVEVKRNSLGGDPKCLGTNRSAYYPQGQSVFGY